MRGLWAAILVAGLFPVQASAQSTIPLTIAFDGYVQNQPSDGVMLRTYDPATGYTLVPFTGPVPEYAYDQGDAVTFTLTTFVPSAADLASGRYDAAKQPDGTYRIPLVGPNNAGSNGVGVVTEFDVSGPIQSTLNSGQRLGGSGLSVFIDPRDSSYTLGTDTGWLFSLFDAPSYSYDPVTGVLSPRSTSCETNCALTGDGGFALRSDDLTSIATTNIPIYGTDRSVRGFFSMLFSGNWSLPTYQPGNPTSVPEPSMLLLFGAGALSVMRRRRADRVVAR